MTRWDEKISRLKAFLKQHSNEKIIVFFLTCASVDFYGNAFQKLFGNELAIEDGKLFVERHGREYRTRRASFQ